MLSLGYLKPFFERKLYFHNRLDANTMLCKDIEAIMLEIEIEYLNNAPGYELIIKALTMKILALLYRHLKLENLAKIAYMTPTYFSSYFKKVMQLNLTEYITYLRMNYSAHLLKETSKNICEIII